MSRSPERGPGRAAAIARVPFRYLNRWLMIPALDAGLGPWMGTPIGGWLLLLRTRGRRSGLIRTVPLSYLIADGSVWIAAGFGPSTEWYRNLLADPSVEIVLPGRRLACRAQEAADESIRRRIIPQFVRATGLPAFLGGIDPYLSSAEQRLRAMRNVPLIRLDPLDGPLQAGPDDPGGRGWIWRQATILGLTLAGAAAISRWRRGRLA